MIYNSVLPALSIVIVGFGWWVLSMKALASSISEEDFVYFAKLKGAGEGRIMTAYVMRNAILPQVTVLALQIGAIFNGALITEILFGYPGLGTNPPVLQADYNLLMGTISISIIAVASSTLVIDLNYPSSIHGSDRGNDAPIQSQADDRRPCARRLHRPWRILPFFSPEDPRDWIRHKRNLPPSAEHLLGTTNLGQDTFWLLSYATQNSFFVGLFVAFFATLMASSPVWRPVLSAASPIASSPCWRMSSLWCRRCRF